MSYTLSIDIGKHNLGYAVMNNEGDIDFDLIDIDSRLGKGGSVMVRRAEVKNRLVSELFEKYEIGKVVIEKQLKVNVVATEIMVLFIGVLVKYTSNIVMFHPKSKFSKSGIEYTTKNKSHKKLAIEVIGKVIEKHFPDKKEKFYGYKKKDDISDAVFMALVEDGHIEMLRDRETKETTEPVTQSDTSSST